MKLRYTLFFLPLPSSLCITLSLKTSNLFDGLCMDLSSFIFLQSWAMCSNPPQIKHFLSILTLFLFSCCFLSLTSCCLYSIFALFSSLICISSIPLYSSFILFLSYSSSSLSFLFLCSSSSHLLLFSLFLCSLLCFSSYLLASSLFIFINIINILYNFDIFVLFSVIIFNILATTSSSISLIISSKFN